MHKKKESFCKNNTISIVLKHQVILPVNYFMKHIQIQWCNTIMHDINAKTDSKRQNRTVLVICENIQTRCTQPIASNMNGNLKFDANKIFRMWCYYYRN